MKRIIYILGMLVLLVGCKDDRLDINQTNVTYSTELINKTECINNSDCDVLWRNEICRNNKCIEVEYFKDYECTNTFWYSPTRGFSNADCINNTCISLEEDCIEIAKSDYKMKEPHCSYKGDMDCWCEDRIIISRERTMNRTNSIQTIPENWKFSEVIYFKIKKLTQ